MTTPKHVNPIAIIEAVRTILNRPAPAFAGDPAPCGPECGRCTAARAQGDYTCRQCGYVGTPLIAGCACVREGRSAAPCGGPSTVDGCGHGSRSCPICVEACDNAADEFFDPMAVVREIREKINEWPRPVRPVNYTDNHVHNAINRAEDAVQLLQVVAAELLESVTDLQSSAEAAYNGSDGFRAPRRRGARR